MNKILFHMHIMWYETKMVIESLDSLANALKYAKNNPQINICLNHQTHLERPIDGSPADMFAEILNHPIFEIANVFEKTDSEPFYGIGDWRREQYNQHEGYTVWGESDCIYPYDTFYILENIKINHPHILTFGCRLMWDDTWREVEFIGLDQYRYEDYTSWTDHKTCPSELRYNGCVLTQEMLDNINDAQGDIDIIKLQKPKFDGALLALSAGLPTPFIAPNQQITHEDFCAQLYFDYLGIPQYHVKNRLKGENKMHPLKRMNTHDKEMAGAARSDDKFKIIADRSKKAMYEFLNEKCR